MENKRLIQILKLIRKQFILVKIDSGICSIIVSLRNRNLISSYEQVQIFNFINANIPTPENQYKVFTDTHLWLNPRSMNEYWWKTSLNHPLGNKIRIDYLSALIENNQKPNKIISFITNINNFIWKRK